MAWNKYMGRKWQKMLIHFKSLVYYSYYHNYQYKKWSDYLCNYGMRLMHVWLKCQEQQAVWGGDTVGQGLEDWEILFKLLQLSLLHCLLACLSTITLTDVINSKGTCFVNRLCVHMQLHTCVLGLIFAGRIEITQNMLKKLREWGSSLRCMNSTALSVSLDWR